MDGELSRKCSQRGKIGNSAATNYACADHCLTYFRLPYRPLQPGRPAIRTQLDTKDTQSQHLRLVVKGDHFPLQTLAQAGEARDMAPDAEILPRSRSRHLLRQETGAPALRKTTRCRTLLRNLGVSKPARRGVINTIIFIN